MSTFFLPLLQELSLKAVLSFENYFFLSLKKEHEERSVVEQVRLESGLIPDFVIVCVQTRPTTVDCFAGPLT